jgi:hypothetical protein
MRTRAKKAALPLRAALLYLGRVTARIILALALLVFAGPARAEEAVDLELVLAIDASASVDAIEWALQMDGYASAFRDPRVKAVLRSGPAGRVAVSVLVWADATVPKSETGWFVLATPEDAERFASLMSGLRRRTQGGTGIGAGIAAAIRKFDRNGLQAPRQVVDVSGDGRETPAREVVVLMPAARAMARARGVTVNGLAILNEDAGLADWYANNVISGPGSFVIRVADYEAFPEAIVRKLVREIAWQPRLSETEPAHRVGALAPTQPSGLMRMGGELADPRGP